MNFEILNQTETAFDEIRLLYSQFNIYPYSGLSLLRDDPITTQNIKDELNRRDYLILNPPKGLSKIIGSSFRIRCQLNVPQPRSGQDLANWLFHNRLTSLLKNWFIPFKHELSVVDKDNRTIRLQEYQQLLNKLSEDLTTFEGTTVGNFPELIDDQTADWSDLFENLNDYLPFVQRAVKNYSVVIKAYLPTVEEQTDSMGRKVKQTISVKPAPPGQTNLTQQQTVLLMYYLRESGIVWKIIDKTTLADCFSVMTGFSEKSLRQSLSNRPDEIAKKADLNALIDQLGSMLVKLKNDAGNL